ncbi:hypothetical protein Hanom_Chr08g00719881 [Helianthus anomalus]
MNTLIRLLFPINLRSVFSYHREQFRNGNKENFPVTKSASAIAKEGGAIWKSMTESLLMWQRQLERKRSMRLQLNSTMIIW